MSFEDPFAQFVDSFQGNEDGGAVDGSGGVGVVDGEGGNEGGEGGDLQHEDLDMTVGNLDTELEADDLDMLTRNMDWDEAFPSVKGEQAGLGEASDEWLSMGTGI